MSEKGGVKEKFSIWHFRLKKVKKHTFLRMVDKKICDAGARHMPTQESGYAAELPVCFPQAPQILQRTLIADAMALRAPRCRLCAF